MGYDIEIGEEHFNYTYNVAPMWYDCYEENGIREFYGLTGEESLPVLQKLANHMENNRDRLLELNPKNGWGNYDGALRFVCDLILAAKRNPQSVWSGD